MIESQKSAPAERERRGAQGTSCNTGYRDGMIGRIVSYSDTAPSRTAPQKWHDCTIVCSVGYFYHIHADKWSDTDKLLFHVTLAALKFHALPGDVFFSAAARSVGFHS
jgi:hypothetical protein